MVIDTCFTYTRRRKWFKFENMWLHLTIVPKQLSKLRRKKQLINIIEIKGIDT